MKRDGSHQTLPGYRRCLNGGSKPFDGELSRDRRRKNLRVARANVSYSRASRTAWSFAMSQFSCLEWWRAAVNHDPDEISRAFKKCDTWDQVTVRRMPTDGDWDKAHPYFCADCGQHRTERGFRISVEKDRN